MPEENKSNGSLVWGVVVVLIAIAAVGGYKYMNKSSSVEAPTATNEQVDINTPSVPEVTTAFKNGTYTVKGGYNSPAGAEEIEVTVVLGDDTITDANVKSLATNPASKNWQTKFLEGVKAQVVGKKLTEVTLTKVSGSSLTPKGWNDAIAKIQSQAKNTPEAI